MGRRAGRAGAVAMGLLALAPSLAGAHVLRVGTYRGMPGTYRTIQSAVNAARPGDTILVGPGVYHERADHSGRYSAAGTSEPGAGVWIHTPRITLRGMNRNRVIVDGTKPGAGGACSAAKARQDLGPRGRSGKPLGRNGIEVFKAPGVRIQNLTACNFLKNPEGGNQIWFNFGDGSGKQTTGSFFGSYLSATDSYYGGTGGPVGSYGIFASNSAGPGVIVHTYASNMDDSDYYVGACRDCNTVVSDAHAQFSSLGYSGTNSGGHLLIERSEWDHNKTGIVTNSQNNDDAPSPALGWCPRVPSRSCTFFQDNFVHDNNNPNVPGAGTAALAPTGTGIVLAGVRGDTVRRNRIVDNGAWGVAAVPFPDTETPPPVAHCEGGIPNYLNTFRCYYDDWGNEVTANAFSHNGFFGNPTNGDLADLSGSHTPGNCWHGNTNTAGAVTSAPGDLQATHGTCGVPNAGADLGSPLATQLICATELTGPCDPATGHYPRTVRVLMPRLRRQKTMPNPCAGVPANPWCPRHNPAVLTGGRRH
ncbi:MAG: hypothetical protein ACXVFN_16430 [Solirubrobacteraceae bacterium]